MELVLIVKPARKSKRFEFILPTAVYEKIFVFLNGLLQVEDSDYARGRNVIVRMRHPVKKTDVIQVLK